MIKAVIFDIIIQVLVLPTSPSSFTSDPALVKPKPAQMSARSNPSPRLLPQVSSSPMSSLSKALVWPFPFVTTRSKTFDAISVAQKPHVRRRHIKVPRSAALLLRAPFPPSPIAKESPCNDRIV